MPVNSKYCTFDPVQKIWSGQKFTPIYNPEANLGYLILQRLIQSPQNVLQISDDTGIELTNLDIYKMSIKFAKFLAKSGLKQGDILGLNASNCEHLGSIIYACFILGIAVNPLAIIMDVNDICYMWSKTRPKIIFCDGKIAEKVKIAVDKMELDAKILTVVEKVEGFLSSDDVLEAEDDNFEDFEFPDLPNISSTNALIICSSGTTNSPKLICKSHKQLIMQVFPFHQPNLETTDVYLTTMSSYWVSFYWFLITCPLYNSKMVITSTPMTIDLYMDIIEIQNATVIACIPKIASLLVKLYKHKTFSNVKVVIVAGAAFTEKIVNEIASIFPKATIHCGYGCTECDCISNTGKNGPKGSSSGYPNLNVNIKIIDKNGKSLESNQIGEMCYQSPVPFSGYFQDTENYKLVIDSDGFIKSGDLGYVDDEGHLFIIDRITHMIRAPNITISPIELEDVINEIDGVMQSCVVGVYDFDVSYDIIYAFVIKDSSKVELTEEFVKNYVNDRVIEAKSIAGQVVFVDKFPMTPSGKVLYRELKKVVEKIHTKVA